MTLPSERASNAGVFTTSSSTEGRRRLHTGRSQTERFEYFAKSEFAQFERRKFTVSLDDQGSVVKQYICHRIWNLYRGTQTAPPLLESVHMALEKWLLSVARSVAPETLQAWCFVSH